MLMSATATRAPSAARRRQVAAPIPDAPPVTSAVRSSSRKAAAQPTQPHGRLRACLPCRRCPYASATRRPPSSSTRARCSTTPSRPSAAAWRSSAISDHFQPWRHTGGHSPAAIPWLGAAGQRTETAVLGTSVLTPTLRYHPAVIAQAFATLGQPHAGADLPRCRHRRGAEREARHRRRDAAPQGAPAAPGGGDRADPPAVERGARGLRGRASTARPKRDRLRPARGAGADLRRRVGAAGRQARRARGRRLHLHQRQGPGAVRGAARQGRGGRAGRGPRPGGDPAHDRDQGLLRPRPRVALAQHPPVGRAGAAARAEGGHRRPDRDGARGRRERRPGAHAASSSPTTPRRWRSASARTPTSASRSSCCTRPGPDQSRFLEQFGADVLPRLRDRFSA